jgi:hypothetical protein
VSGKDRIRELSKTARRVDRVTLEVLNRYTSANINEAEAQEQLRRRYRVNEREAQFIARVVLKHKSKASVYRSGWPDFLLVEDGRAYAVEVKQGPNDRIRYRQAVMFEALESSGLRVYVWSPQTADRLTPWRYWLIGKVQRLRPNKKRKPQRWTLEEERERDRGLRKMARASYTARLQGRKAAEAFSRVRGSTKICQAPGANGKGRA